MFSSPNRLLATAFGAIYIVIGLLGFVVTAGLDFFATQGGLLLGLFLVNGFHNVVHLVIGVVLLICGLRSVRSARAANPIVGAICLVLGLVGLFIIGSDANVLAVNGNDNVLHFGTAIVLLAVGLGADKSRARTETA